MMFQIRDDSPLLGKGDYISFFFFFKQERWGRCIGFFFFLLLSRSNLRNKNLGLTILASKIP